MIGAHPWGEPMHRRPPSWVSEHGRLCILVLLRRTLFYGEYLGLLRKETRWATHDRRRAGCSLADSKHLQALGDSGKRAFYLGGEPCD